MIGERIHAIFVSTLLGEPARSLTMSEDLLKDEKLDSLSLMELAGSSSVWAVVREQG